MLLLSHPLTSYLFSGHGGLSLATGDSEKVDSMLVMSGGEGYIDFRLGRSTHVGTSRQGDDNG